VRILPIALLTASSLVTVVLAQETRQNIVAEKKSTPNATSPVADMFPFHPILAWSGKRFIFLPRPKSSETSIYDDFTGRLLPEKYAGRVAKVLSVTDLGGRALVEFEMESDGERLRARSYLNKESIKGIALVDDLENARNHWKGKMVWSKGSMISSYNPQTDLLSTLHIKKCSPLKVIDVVAGWDEEKPVRFELETTDGKRGFIDLNLSGVNVQKETRSLGRFEHHLFWEDPRLKNKWSPAVWRSIENSQILTGMTQEQVRLSWGEPDKITRTAAGEEWTFPAGVLIFKNGTLASTR
jgi:hypothetical protein